MKNVILLVATCAVLISLVAGSTVMAAGKSNAGLYLYEKDPTNWTIVTSTISPDVSDLLNRISVF